MSTNLHIDDIGNLIFRDGKLSLSVSSQYVTPPHYGGGRVGALSPYAYCAGDPVNFIDPTGEAYWHLSKWGYIREIIPSKYCQNTVIYCELTKKIYLLSNESEAYDAILSNLHFKYNDKGKPYSSAWSTASADQILTLMLIFGLNSIVEWSGVIMNEGWGIIGTNYETDKVKGIAEMLTYRNSQGNFITYSDLILSIHSHPDEEGKGSDSGTRGGSLYVNKYGDKSGDLPNYEQQKKRETNHRPFVLHRETKTIYEYNESVQALDEYDNLLDWKKIMLKWINQQTKQ